MTNEEIEKFQNKVYSLLNIQKNVNNLEKEIKRYEDIDIVREYLILKKRLETVKRHGVHKLNYEQILEKALKEIKISETNNIYVYVSSYKGTHQLNYEHKENELPLADMIVSYDDPSVDYRKYINIELSPSDGNYEINVPISKCEEFEHNNIVLRSNVKPGREYYNEIRAMYFSTIYIDGESRALEKIKSKRKMQGNCKNK